MFKSGNFERLLEKATSKLLLDPDWDSILQISDSIRQGDVQPSYAILNIRKKIDNENPHVSKFALLVLESAVKNCGSLMHNEIATRDFMDFMKDQARKRQDPVKAKIVELIQVWSHAFRNEPSYRVVQDAFAEMKREGFTFPALKESDAMFVSEKAPDWVDGECCHRCRVQFGVVQRKHHCRACGQIFCGKCSSKTSIVPKYGIEKEVRVCDSCFDVLNKPASERKGEDDLPAEYLASSLSKQPQAPPQKSEQEIQEEEDLQLALALSQSEQEAKEKDRHRGKTSSYSSISSSSDNNAIYAQPSKMVSAPPAVIDTSDMDPELARYLNRNYWQQKSVEMKTSNTSTTQPSAPAISAEPKMSSSGAGGPNFQQFTQREDEKYQNGETGSSSNTVADEEREQFLAALRSSIEIFVNRMRSNSQRGRSIANDSSVQTLFMTLTAMHPQLMRHIQEQEDQRAHYESLQDKLAQLKDARDALNVLREEHREKRRREQEELERLRQIQMAQKLEALRLKKQEMLEFQRQIALQRMQEQEMEMRRRLEQQKQEQQIRAMQYSYPQFLAASLMNRGMEELEVETMYSTAGQPGMPPYNTGMPAEGSPHHQMHPAYSQPGPGYPLPAQQAAIPPQQGPAMGPMGMPPGSQIPGGYAPPIQGHQGTTVTAGYANVPQNQVSYTMQGGYSSAPGMQYPSGPGPVPTTGQQMAYQTPGVPTALPAQQLYMSGPVGQVPGQPGQPGMEYQPYNVQGLSNTLPPNVGYPGQVPGGQYPGGQPQPAHMMPGQHGHPMGMHQQQQLQQQPGPNEAALAELINFD